MEYILLLHFISRQYHIIQTHKCLEKNGQFKDIQNNMKQKGNSYTTTLNGFYLTLILEVKLETLNPFFSDSKSPNWKISVLIRMSIS